MSRVYWGGKGHGNGSHRYSKGRVGFKVKTKRHRWLLLGQEA